MKIEYYWNEDEIQFEIDLINPKGEVKKKYFQPTKMWAEDFIEKIKEKIKDKVIISEIKYLNKLFG